MSTIDNYKDEPVAEIDRDIYFAWLKAKADADRAKAEAERLRIKLEAMVGKAQAGTIDGIKVLTYRPVEKYREAALRGAYPALTDLYMTEKTVVEFDVAAFAKMHPDEAEQFRSRQFRVVEVKA